MKVETSRYSRNVFKEEETEEMWVISLEIVGTKTDNFLLYRDFFPTLLLKTCDNNVIVCTIGQEVRLSQFPDDHIHQKHLLILAPKLGLASATLGEQSKMAAPCVSFE